MGRAERAGDARVRVVRAGDPGAEAARLAADLGAEIATDAPAALAALRARADAARAAAAAADPPGEGDDAVLARAEKIRAAAASRPPIDDRRADELRRLAVEMGRAARILERTEARVAAVVGARVGTTAGVVLHPAALADAAEAVRAAEEALAEAERALLRHGSPPVVGSGAGEVAEAAAQTVAGGEQPLLSPHDDFDFDEARLERRRSTAVAALVVALAVTGLLVAAALGMPVPVAVVAAAAAAAGALAWQRLAAVPDGTGDRAVAEALSLAAQLVDDTELARRAAALAGEDRASGRAAEPGGPGGPGSGAGVRLTALDLWERRRRELEAERDQAAEVLRVARARWHQLAGADADPHDADAVIRAHDPQLALAPRTLSASPSVRTAAAFARRTAARWWVAWAALGHDEPPDPAAVDAAIAEHRRAAEDLARLDAAEARRRAAELVRRPLVVLEEAWPGDDAEAERLLAALPPGAEVVVVEQDG